MARDAFGFRMEPKTYEIYVCNTNRWEEQCPEDPPDYRGVFFSPRADERYIGPNEGGELTVGSLLVIGYSRARERVEELNRSGEWKYWRRPRYVVSHWYGRHLDTGWGILSDLDGTRIELRSCAEVKGA